MFASMRFRKFIYLVLFTVHYSLFTELLQAQSVHDKYSLHIHHATAPFKIDGVIDEPDWQLADVAKDFLPYFLTTLLFRKAKLNAALPTTIIIFM